MVGVVHASLNIEHGGKMSSVCMMEDVCMYVSKGSLPYGTIKIGEELSRRKMRGGGEYPLVVIVVVVVKDGSEGEMVGLEPRDRH